MLSFGLTFILSYGSLLQGRGQDGTFWFRGYQERGGGQEAWGAGENPLVAQGSCYRKRSGTVPGLPPFSYEKASWASRFLPRLLQPQGVASLGLVVPLPQVARCLGPGSRLLPGAVHLWAWRAASAAVGGGLAPAALPWDPVPGRELPGHWQATSPVLRLFLPGPVRASPGRSRERTLLESEISRSFTN